jgi:hypothetical protein
MFQPNAWEAANDHAARTARQAIIVSQHGQNASDLT